MQVGIERLRHQPLRISGRLLLRARRCGFLLPFLSLRVGLLVGEVQEAQPPRVGAEAHLGEPHGRFDEVGGCGWGQAKMTRELRKDGEEHIMCSRCHCSFGGRPRRRLGVQGVRLGPLLDRI